MPNRRSSTLIEKSDTPENFLSYLGSYKAKADSGHPAVESGSRGPVSRGWPTLRLLILCIILAVTSAIGVYYSWLPFWASSIQAQGLSLTIEKAEITRPVSCVMLTLAALEEDSRLCARGTAVLRATLADGYGEVTVGGVEGALFTNTDSAGACFMLGDFKVGPQTHTTTTVPFYLITRSRAKYARLSEQAVDTCVAWLNGDIRTSGWTFQFFLPRIIIRDLKLSLKLQ